MYCLRCGTKIDDNTEYCPHCGANIKEEQARYNYQPREEITPTINLQPTHEEQFQYSKNYSNSTTENNNITFSKQEEDYLKAYVGKNYEKIKNSNFSLLTFFLGPIYFFYRKLYIEGLILCFFFIMLPSLYLIGIIITAIAFKTIYLKHALQKIKTIKNTNHGLDYETILQKCRKQGGTNIWIPIIVVVGTGTIIAYSVISTTKELIAPISETTTPLTSDTTYQEYGLSYIIPKGFSLNYESKQDYYLYQSYDNENYCNIYIQITTDVNYYEDEIDYLSNIVLANDKDKIDSITTTAINNNDWKKLTMEREYSIQTYYVLEKNNNFYRIETNSSKENTTICQKEFDKTLNSLTYENKK